MAAVAGAVAEEVLEAMTTGRKLARAYVNNGGDIALHLTGREQFTVGLMDRPDAQGVMRTMTVEADSPVRGIATSGRRGRSRLERSSAAGRTESPTHQLFPLSAKSPVALKCLAGKYYDFIDSVVNSGIFGRIFCKVDYARTGWRRRDFNYYFGNSRCGCRRGI